MFNKTLKSAFVISILSTNIFSANVSHGAAAAVTPAVGIITPERQAIIDHVTHITTQWDLTHQYYHFSQFFRCRKFIPTAVTAVATPATFPIYVTHLNAAGSPAIARIRSVAPRPTAAFAELAVTPAVMQSFVAQVAELAVMPSNPCGVTGLVPGAGSIETSVGLGSLTEANVLYAQLADGSMNENVCYSKTGTVTTSATSPLAGVQTTVGTQILAKNPVKLCKGFANKARFKGVTNVVGTTPTLNTGILFAHPMEIALADALAAPNFNQNLMTELYASQNNLIAADLYTLSPAEPLTSPLVGTAVSIPILNAAYESLNTTGVIPKAKFDAIVGGLNTGLNQDQAKAAFDVIAPSSLDAANSATVAAGVSITATPAAITSSTLQSVQTIEASAK